jgi:hypothetical protein
MLCVVWSCGNFGHLLIAYPLPALQRQAAFLRWQKLWLRSTIIIGVGPNAADVDLALQSQPEMSLHVLCFADAGGAEDATEPQIYPRLSLDKLPSIAKQPGVQWVIALQHTQSDQREIG